MLKPWHPQAHHEEQRIVPGTFEVFESVTPDATPATRVGPLGSVQPRAGGFFQLIFLARRLTDVRSNDVWLQRCGQTDGVETIPQCGETRGTSNGGSIDTMEYVLMD